MEEKTNSIAKRNIYLILAAIAIVAVIVGIIIAIVNGSRSTQIEAKSAKPSASISTPTSKSVDTPKSIDTPKSDNPSTSEPDKPTTVQIVFEMPVSGGQIINDFTAASVTYNKTLGIYTGHMAIDIGGSEGASVVAAYDGVISAITTSYLEGTTVVVDHGNSLSTVYNSIEVNEDLAVGNTVAKGQAIGVISTNNRQEYKDGAHLHFETLENGVAVSPYKYLSIEGK